MTKAFWFSEQSKKKIDVETENGTNYVQVYFYIDLFYIAGCLAHM